MYIISNRSNFHRHFKSRKRVVVSNFEERENKIQFFHGMMGEKVLFHISGWEGFYFTSMHAWNFVGLNTLIVLLLES